MRIFEEIGVKFDGFIDLDMETRSKCNLLDSGEWVYANDPSTEILILRYSIEGGKIWGWRKGDEPPFRLFRALEKGFQIRAHNWIFEYCVWNFSAVKKMNWPKMHYSRFDCTMALSCRFGFPASLENAANAMGLDVSKDKKGTQLITKFSTPSRKKNVEWNEPNDYIQEFNDFDEYCKNDVLVQQNIVKFVPHLLEPNELKIFRLTQLINVRGIPIDLVLCKQAAKIKRRFILDATKEIKILTKNKIENIRSKLQVKNFLEENNCAVPDLQAGTIDNLLNGKMKIKPLIEKVLKTYKLAGKNSVSKFNKAIASAQNGNFHGGIVYYGASKTGRFAGRQLQPHNFAKPTLPENINLELIAELIKEKDYFSIEFLADDLMSALSSSLRSMFRAPENKIFHVADYSQIEARKVFWFAGQLDAIQAFINKEDIYVNTAAEVYQKNIRDIGSFERFIGKQIVLGLGFGLAHEKFRNQIIEYAKFDIGETFAKKVVKFYRTKYKKVPQVWKELNDNAIRAITSPNKKFYCCDKKIYYIFNGIYLICCLPSGRFLYYPFAKVRMVKKWGKEIPEISYKTFDQTLRKWVDTTTWGGKLLENICQASSRDLMCNGMLNAEEKDYPNIFNVHDEIITLTEKNFGSKTELENIMCILPEWAKGFPIAAKGYSSKIYKKG